MANQEHLDILSQGVKVWNQWRNKNVIMPDLRGADLHGANLCDADLHGANLRGTDLIGTDLRGANLCGTDLHSTDLHSTDLSRARLINANLSRAVLSDADLSRANLSGAGLSSANLRRAGLSGAILYDANLADAKIHYTVFARNDLSVVKGIESVKHQGPSTIGIDTLVKSKGQILESFLRGCGLSDWQIEEAKLYNTNLSNEEINEIQYRIHDLRVRQAIQISPLFISYSHKDGPFVDAIEKHLTQQGIRYWRDTHHAKAGRLETQIDRAISVNDIVLLILSKYSTKSDWVEHEVRKARAKEKKKRKDALCPIALDKSWRTCRWPERLREQIMEYNILDFSNWQDGAHFQKTFGKLLEGLNLFYK